MVTAKFRKEEEPLMVRNPDGTLRSAVQAAPAQAPAESLLYRTGQGLREVVVPAAATGLGALLDVYSAPTRAAYSGLKQAVAGLTGEPAPEEFKFTSATKALPQAVSRALAPTAPPSALVETTVPEPEVVTPPPTTGLRSQSVTSVQAEPPAAASVSAPVAQIAPATARQAAVSQGLRFGAPEEQELYERVGLKEMMQSPYPGFQTGLYTDPGSGESTLIEMINGGPSGPALRQPFVSPKRFRSITGYDQEGNAIYSTGAAEMAAANAAIAEYNRGLLEKYGGQADIWKAGQVDIPKGLAQAGLFQSQAGLAEARADEVPREGASLRAMRAAQQQNVGAQTAANKLIKLKVPGPPDIYGQPTTREIAMDRSGKVYDPMAMQQSPRQQLQDLAAGMTDERKSIVQKYIRNNPNETEASILQRIQAGEL
jgi:hypothetical protein